jgi:hypothetical protein
MKHLIPSVAFSLVLSAGAHAASAIIFDNAPTIGNPYYNSGGIAGTTGGFGAQVTAGGTERTITELLTGFSADATTTANVSLTFYTVGAGNAVGSQIGTMTLPSHSITAGYNALSFTGLSVTVPDNFIWGVTIQYTIDWGHVPMVGSSPSVGSTASGSLYTVFGPGATPTSFFGPGSGNTLATITAVPEPAFVSVVAGALAWGVGGLARWRGRRRTDREVAD